jgi:dolichol-phosphate mannosyltransferase
VHIILPAYNEEGGLGSLLGRICEVMKAAELDYGVIVVDDGSSDGTAAVALAHKEHLPVTLIAHEHNRGLGAAMRSGFQAVGACAGEDDIVVTMDADDTHHPDQIEMMVSKIDAGCDVVIASRYRRGSIVKGVPAHRRFTSWAGSMLFRLVLPIRGVRDFTCGYRAYRVHVLKQALDHYGEGFVEHEGFQCMVDVLLKLRPFGLCFGEVPFVLRYDLKAGVSKMAVSSTIVNTLKLILKRRFCGCGASR